MAKQFIRTKRPRQVALMFKKIVVFFLLQVRSLSPETAKLSVQLFEQTKQVLKNISAILAEAGTDFDHVVKTTCFLSDMDDFVPFNECTRQPLRLIFQRALLLKLLVCQKTSKWKLKSSLITTRCSIIFDHERIRYSLSELFSFYFAFTVFCIFLAVVIIKRIRFNWLTSDEPGS